MGECSGDRRVCNFLSLFDLAWELLPFWALRVPICLAEFSARQIGTHDKIR